MSSFPQYVYFSTILQNYIYESLSTPPTLQFYFLITTVHPAGFHLERAGLCQAYHLIHQRHARQLSMPHTPQPCPSRAAPLLVTLLRCAVETSDITASLCLHLLPKYAYLGHLGYR